MQLPDNESFASEYGPQEIAYARRLSTWWARPPPPPRQSRPDPTAPGAPPRLAPAQAIPAQLAASRTAKGARSRQLLTIADIREGVFCDTVAMVLSWQPKLHSHAPSGDLYIADWTENDQLYAFEPEVAAGRVEGKWPVGQRAMQVTVYGQEMEPFEGWGKEEVAGRMVYVKNLGPRRNPNGLLEGRVSDMGQRPEDRRLIRFLKEGEYQEERMAIVDRLKKSRAGQDTAGAAGADAGQAEAEPVTMSDVQEAAVRPVTVVAQPELAPELDQTMRLTLEKEELKPVVSSPPTPPPEQDRFAVQDIHFEPPSILDTESIAEAVVSTQRVHNALADVPLATMGFALTEAPDEGRFRLRGRIVDYAPPRLQDWVIARCGECAKV